MYMDKLTKERIQFTKVSNKLDKIVAKAKKQRTLRHRFIHKLRAIKDRIFYI